MCSWFYYYFYLELEENLSQIEVHQKQRNIFSVQMYFEFRISIVQIFHFPMSFENSFETGSGPLFEFLVIKG